MNPGARMLAQSRGEQSSPATVGRSLSVVSGTDSTTALAAVDLDDPRTWDRLIDLVGPASLLVVAETRMGPRLLESFRPEDVLQDVLMQAWSARAKLEWRGLRPFRNWLLTVLDNRIRDMRGYQAAEKRGGAVRTIRISELVRTPGGAFPTVRGPETSVTPSRLAIHHEQACAMRDALLTLPEDLRDVLRLRLFEGRSAEEAAEELGLGLAAVRYRLRRGSELYRMRLLRLFRSRIEERSRA